MIFLFRQRRKKRRFEKESEGDGHNRLDLKYIKFNRDYIFLAPKIKLQNFKNPLMPIDAPSSREHYCIVNFQRCVNTVLK